MDSRYCRIFLYMRNQQTLYVHSTTLALYDTGRKKEAKCECMRSNGPCHSPFVVQQPKPVPTYVY